MNNYKKLTIVTIDCVITADESIILKDTMREAYIMLRVRG